MKLFEPITIRGMTLKNRIIMLPMDVHVRYRSKRAIEYYAERARGGAGAITVAGTFVDVFASDEAWGEYGGAARFVDGIRCLTEAVHQAGGKVGIQIVHHNRYPLGLSPLDIRGELVAPSPRQDRSWFTRGSFDEGLRELTIYEIESIIAKFAKAAANVRKAGFDFVELHSAHSYLHCQFFTPTYNRRTDKFGGDLLGRTKFGVDTVIAMREAVGDDYPIFVRIPGTELRPGGVTIGDAIEYAVRLEKAGADLISVSLVERSPYTTAFPDHPMGCYANLSASIKQRLSIPVITAGRINRPEIAEAILNEGKADLIGIGRQLIADPFWPQKVQRGLAEDIRPCLSCNACLEPNWVDARLRCSVNALAGKEGTYRLAPTEKPKTIIIIGGGPGGMEASRIAALRGHRVILVEKGAKLGGQLLVACVAPYKEVVKEFNQYLTRQVEKAGVEVRLNTEATVNSIEELKADAIIVATGVVPFIPDITGIERTNVILAEDVLTGAKQAGAKVAIMGGELTACDTAEFLAEQGKTITMLRRGSSMAMKITIPHLRKYLLDRLEAKGITMFTGVTYQEITESGIVFIDNKGDRRVLSVDTVVLATGGRPNELGKQLKSKCNVPVYCIGDCVETRTIRDAVHEGASVAYQI